MANGIIRVKSHTRSGTPVKSHTRGGGSSNEGTKSLAILKDGKVHYTGFYGEDTKLNKDGVTASEQDIIRDYTSRGFRSVNGGTENIENISYVHALNLAISNHPNRVEGIVYRGLGFNDIGLHKEILNEYKSSIGEVIRHDRFLSTSKDKKVAENFTKDLDYIHSPNQPSKEVYVPMKKTIMLIITSKSGKDISKYSVEPRQKETLFKTTAKFLIKKVVKNEVHLEEVEN